MISSPRLREKYRGDAEDISIPDQKTRGIDLFKKYSASYGCVFFVMKRAG